LALASHLGAGRAEHGKLAPQAWEGDDNQSLNVIILLDILTPGLLAFFPGSNLDSPWSGIIFVAEL
jgi:hypothetical protein